ncbi:hypothetical protein RN001_009404 [Aquatica leii]|uniref:28S ribosomal protein S9, mitochondrial n=1 Tax=Aquatica leii TaxID=1421715 RepID=A0AAN7SMX4_9COLE|nr:hypothetical protein RN001_009404 [Aquatica leii]
MHLAFRKNFLIITLFKEQVRKCSPKSMCTTKFDHVSQKSSISEQPKKQVVSKAMKAYLERAREHDTFMQKQQHEFQIGKRHLANMMGEDPETFTQDNVDNAIEYLFPSGLYDKKARPMMKPPEEVFPQRKAAEFDESGRPFHFMFYTGKPNFYKLLYDIAENINNLYKFEDSRIRKNLAADSKLALDLSGYQWVQKEALEKMLLETIGDRDYDSFVAAMERLCNLQYSYRVKDFILTYKKPLISQTKTYDVPKLQYDKDGRAYITTYECFRKRAHGHVTIRSPGVGEIKVNGQDLDYFKDTQPREQLTTYKFQERFQRLNQYEHLYADDEGYPVWLCLSYQNDAGSLKIQSVFTEVLR